MLYAQSFGYFSSATLNMKQSGFNDSSSVNVQPTLDVIPYPLFILICGSLCTSTMAMAFSALTLSVSPLLYIFIPVFVLTISYHGLMFFLSNTQNPTSERLFSRVTVMITCVLSMLWIAALGIAIDVNVLIGMGKLNTTRGSWSAIIPAICAFIEAIFIGSIAFLMQKERKRVLYNEKWKWRTAQPAAITSGSTQR